MLPIKTILCTTDFSDLSFRGVDAADELSRHFGAKLVVLHVIAPVPMVVPGETLAQSHTTGGFDVTRYQENLERMAQEQLQEVARERGWNDEERIVLMIRKGNSSVEILKTAERVDADLIVIATHGRHGVKRFVLGSVAEKVVRRADRPVLTVHLD